MCARPGDQRRGAHCALHARKRERAALAVSDRDAPRRARARGRHRGDVGPARHARGARGPRRRRRARADSRGAPVRRDRAAALRRRARKHCRVCGAPPRPRAARRALRRARRAPCAQAPRRRVPARQENGGGGARRALHCRERERAAVALSVGDAPRRAHAGPAHRGVVGAGWCRGQPRRLGRRRGRGQRDCGPRVRGCCARALRGRCLRRGRAILSRDRHSVKIENKKI